MLVQGEKEEVHMAFNFEIFADKGLQESFIEWLISEKAEDIRKNFGRLWDYYANEMRQVRDSMTKSCEVGRDYVLAQERGLPARISGATRMGLVSTGDIQRKEVVIENDIAWRVNAMVDFLFGKPVNIVSKATERQKRREIEAILGAMFEANGGIGFFQDMAVLGSVYGFVDCLVRPNAGLYESAFSPQAKQPSVAEAIELARGTGLELVEAPRALPILDEGDYRKVRYYVQHFMQQKNSVNGGASFLSRLLGGGGSGIHRECVAITEIIGPDAWQRYEDGELATQEKSPWGFVPVVHIQNVAQPYYYEGQSDVESLVPLQDELNTRLSDRASRITMQAFKMYLLKCMDKHTEKAVSPGRIWHTSDPNASIEEFGGDAGALSEDAHINELREAMDKTSGVTPIVAGLLKSKLGNLTSAVALKMTLMGTLSKTERKKFTYGRGIARLGAILLEMLDKSGVYPNNEEDRGIEVIFPSPLPEDTMEKLKEAQLKRELGVSQEQVLRELGYEAGPDGTIAERIEV
jgi:hypothetical protein